MKKFINTFASIGLVVSFLTMAVYVTYIRFANIDMTETRVFFTYWKEYSVILVIFIIFAVLHSATNERNH